MSDFQPGRWAYHGDHSPEDRAIRVLDHYNVEYWWVANTLHFVTSNPVVVGWVGRGIEPFEDARLVRVGSTREMVRFRVESDA